MTPELEAAITVFMNKSLMMEGIQVFVLAWMLIAMVSKDWS